jgi:hypothetical protein
MHCCCVVLLTYPAVQFRLAAGHAVGESCAQAPAAVSLHQQAHQHIRVTKAAGRWRHHRNGPQHGASTLGPGSGSVLVIFKGQSDTQRSIHVQQPHQEVVRSPGSAVPQPVKLCTTGCSPDGVAVAIQGLCALDSWQLPGVCTSKGAACLCQLPVQLDSCSIHPSWGAWYHCSSCWCSVSRQSPCSRHWRAPACIGGVRQGEGGSVGGLHPPQHTLLPKCPWMQGGRLGVL